MAKYSVVDGHGEIVDFDQKELDLAFSHLKSGVALSSKERQILSSKIGKRSVEILDPTPMAPPVGFVRRPPLHELVRQMVQRELSQAASSQGFETAEEADDFDVGEELEPSSEYEHEFEPGQVLEAPEPVKRLEERIADALEKLAGGGGAQPPSGQPNSPAPSQGGSSGAS